MVRRDNEHEIYECFRFVEQILSEKTDQRENQWEKIFSTYTSDKGLITRI
jgi:hypothetical protein